MQTRFLRLALCVVILLGGGCGREQATSPDLPKVAAVPESVTRPTADGATLLAGFRIAVDEATLAATVTPWRQGTAQPPQGQRYDLDIANFQNADSLRITGVQVLGSGNFRLTFSHAHPFPAPNVANPATGTNRADLGYTGRLMVLTSFNPKVFFSGDVRLSAGAVVSPDGYVEPGDLLLNQGPSLVTAYPYKLLADEAQDNRVGISNGGSAQGNYAPASGGWQRVNLGAAGDGWTGYDYLHGGQTITNQLVLSRDSLEASSFALDVALLIQYTDPRGAGGVTHRLPPAAIDVLDFAYRLPYAALDCSRILPVGNITLGSEPSASTTLEVRLRDWDSQAVETADATVGDEADVALIQVGASGAPEIVLDSPDLLTTGLRNLGSPTSGTGSSASPLIYSNSLPNQLGAGPGLYYGCLRITDPEMTDTDRGSYHAGVDPTTLVPSAARAVPARTWQIVPITIGSNVPVITQVMPNGSVGAVGGFVIFTASIAGAVDSVNWSFGGGAIPNTSSSLTPEVQLAWMPGVYVGELTASNAAGESDPFPFSFQVLGPQRPAISGAPVFGATTSIQTLPHHSAMLIYQGKPVVAFLYASLDPPTSGMMILMAKTALPEGPADWTQAIHWDANAEGTGISLAEVNGLIAFTTGLSDRLMYGYATVPNPSPPNWEAGVIRGTGGGALYGRQQALVGHGTRPAILAWRHDSDEVLFLRGASVGALSAGEWVEHQLNPVADRCALTTIVAGGSPRLAAVSTKSAGPEIVVHYAKFAEPEVIGDWTELSINVTNAGAVDIASADFGSGEMGLAIAVGRALDPLVMTLVKVGAGNTLEAVDIYEMGIAGSGTSYPSLTSLNGRLAVAVTEGIGQRVTLARALTVFPGQHDWGYISLTGPGRYQPQLDSVENRLLCFALDGRDPWVNELYFTDGPW